MHAASPGPTGTHAQPPSAEVGSAKTIAHANPAGQPVPLHVGKGLPPQSLNGNGGKVEEVVATVELVEVIDVVAPGTVEELVLEVVVLLVLVVGNGDVVLVVLEDEVVVGGAPAGVGHADALGFLTAHMWLSSAVSVPPAAPPNATQ